MVGAFDRVSILKSMDIYSFIIHPGLMPNFRGFAYILFQGVRLEWLTAAITLLISVVLYALCLYLWCGQVEALDFGFDLTFAVIIVTIILISYHLYLHDLFALSLSLVLIFCYVNIYRGAQEGLSKALLWFLISLCFFVIPRYLIKFNELACTSRLSYCFI